MAPQGDSVGVLARLAGADPFEEAPDVAGQMVGDRVLLVDGLADASEEAFDALGLGLPSGTAMGAEPILRQVLLIHGLVQARKMEGPSTAVAADQPPIAAACRAVVVVVVLNEC